MALASVSEAKNRLFGRRTSNAMLRYVWEKLLEAGTTSVSKDVEKRFGTAGTSAGGRAIAKAAKRWHKQPRSGTAAT